MLQSRISGWAKNMTIAVCLGLFMSISSVALALETNHIARWVHTGFYMHKTAYENDRVVLSLLDDSSFDLNYISYFEDNDDKTWEKNMEASGSYQIRGSDIIFTIKVLVGSEDREKPHYSCPFTLNKKALILSKCELLNMRNVYEFKRTDPNAFHYQ